MRTALSPIAQWRALRAMVEDPALRMRMGEAGRARALLHCSEQDVVERTLNLLGL